MSDTRLVAAFRGAAHCRRESGAVQWCISGLDREQGTPLEVLLAGAPGVQLPPELAGAELHVRDRQGHESWELRASGAAYPLAVRAVQVHRDAGAAFAAALPEVGAPWTTRAAWWLLLWLLRVPGVAGLLQRFRSRMGE